MPRFRILFILAVVLVIGPVGLLVRRAIDSVELEQRTRHQAVAERIFDEMERALSELLTREEERPCGQYSHDYVPQGQEGDALVRSPLADPPSLPFILGYFQIDPDGGLETPLQPGRAGEAPATPGGRTVVDEMERAVTSYFRSGAGVARSRAGVVSQLPGTTVALSNDSVRRDESLGAGNRVTAYDALRALNKGIEQRAARQAKTELEYAPAPGLGRRAAPAARPELANEPAAAVQATDAKDPARIEIAPMVGRVIDAHRMLLYRTVVRDTQTYRQGLLLDLDALASWLRAQALGTNGIATYATVAVGNTLAPVAPTDSTSAFVYQHRLAEPFADLSARLTLHPLPGVGDANYVYALCAVVVLVGGLGLFALYRMVSVTVSYAERRTNFVAAVSHELKTPLTAIRMYGEMLRDGIVPAEAKRAEYYRHITTESERLSRLINNVLEFSRLEKGTRQMSLATGSLSQVVAEAADLLRPHAEREGFTLDVDVDPSLPAVRFERDALLQVLFNLVDNAVKYARASDPQRIALSCHAAGGEVDLAVRDHGPGIARHHLRRVFEPFYRGESELTRRSKGTGLGLALVRSLAEHMGARVRARNVIDGGFEVAVIFPTKGVSS